MKPKSTDKPDKLVLQVKKFVPGENNVVRLTDEATELVREIQFQSGLPARHIVSEMVKFAAERVEIKEI